MLSPNYSITGACTFDNRRDIDNRPLKYTNLEDKAGTNE